MKFILSIQLLFLFIIMNQASDKSTLFQSLYQEKARPGLTCEGLKLPKTTNQISHKRSKFIQFAGEPSHVAQDIVATPSDILSTWFKAQYGMSNKDLQNEWIEIFLLKKSKGKCEYISLGSSLSDENGVAELKFQAPRISGDYELVGIVPGDQTHARFNLKVIRKKSDLIVFDIDGTLTKSDKELSKYLWRKIYFGKYVPKSWPGAASIAKVVAQKGYPILYLTGRPYFLKNASQKWLDDHGFPAGSLILTNHLSQCVPNIKGVGTFKLNALEKISSAGVKIKHAFGNATTDIYAYLNAGLTGDRVHIIGKHAGEQGTEVVLDYRRYLRVVQNFKDAR